jgi:hypothetical protein
MALEDWIDALCAIWEISDGKGGQVRSYRVFEKSEFPEAITDTPCAITYTTGVIMQITASGGHGIWRGVTEFHLSEGINKSRFPEYIRYFARIRAAMAANMKLGGLVDHLRVNSDVTPSVQGPVVLVYGSEQPHHGIVVYWEVKEGATDTVVA